MKNFWKNLKSTTGKVQVINSIKPIMTEYMTYETPILHNIEITNDYQPFKSSKNDAFNAWICICKKYLFFQKSYDNMTLEYLVYCIN